MEYYAPESGFHIKRDEPMEAQGTKINQQPELYLAADVEQMAKGGWKRTIKCSVRVFDGNRGELYDALDSLLTSGLNIADMTINLHEQEKEQGKVLSDE